MIFREKIARWLSPTLARQADRFHYLWHQADDCHRWLSEFPEISLSMQWLKEKDRDHWRKIEEPAVGKLPSSIVNFRELLRSRQAPPAPNVEGRRLPYDLRLQVGKALDRLVCNDSTPEQVDKFISIFAEFGLTISQAQPKPRTSCHPSHTTRSSDSSHYDEVCTKCGATDIAGGGWGRLAEPCSAGEKP